MKNKKSNLTESQLNGIVKKVLNEIGYDDPMVHAGELHRMIEALRNVEANVEGMNEFLGGDPDDTFATNNLIDAIEEYIGYVSNKLDYVAGKAFKPRE